MKRGLDLKQVVLLGRTFEEYRRYFALEPALLSSHRILDVAAGVSSFCAEARTQGYNVTAVDPIYRRAPEEIARQSQADLDHVAQAIHGLEVYRWSFYESPAKMRAFRSKALELFLRDFRGAGGSRYVAAALPRLPFAAGAFDLTLASYFLFAYQDQFSYEFHRDSILELMRVTSKEARIYPIVTFEAERSIYLDRLRADPFLAHLHFEEVQTDFEFLANSNYFLRVAPSSPGGAGQLRPRDKCS